MQRRAAAGAAAGQGRLRGHLRGQEPPDLARHPPGVDRRDAAMTDPSPPSPSPSPSSEVSLGELERLVSGQHHDPHSILGAHPGPDGVVVRALRPLARSVILVLDDGRRMPMTHLYQGVFTVTLAQEKVPDYRIATSYGPDDSDESVTDDPYRFLPQLSEYDLYLIGEGRHEELWQV